MRKLAFLAAGAAMFAIAAPAMANDLPPLPNDGWSYGDPIDGVDVSTTVTHDVFNQALLASGGRASDLNRSDFDNVTTTTTTTTTTTYPAINPGKQVVAEHSYVDATSITVDSSTVKIKVK